MVYRYRGGNSLYGLLAQGVVDLHMQGYDIGGQVRFHLEAHQQTAYRLVDVIGIPCWSLNLHMHHIPFALRPTKPSSHRHDQVLSYREIMLVVLVDL